MTNTKKKETLYRGKAVSVLGFKVGSNTAIAANLYLKKRGATTEEVKEELVKLNRLPRAHLNLLSNVEKQGHKVERGEDRRKSTDGKKDLKVYRIIPKK